MIRQVAVGVAIEGKRKTSALEAIYWKVARTGGTGTLMRRVALSLNVAARENLKRPTNVPPDVQMMASRVCAEDKM